MHARLLRDRLLAIAFRDWSRGRYAGDAASIPDAAHVVAGNDLRKPSCFDMPDLNEPAIEEKDVWRMPCDMLSSTLPLDSTI